MDVNYYLYHFARLHTAKFKGKAAPHKAVLLLAVMRMIEKGSIQSPEIELTDELVCEFKRIWMEKLPSSCPFTCDISKPFFHMQHEPFWKLLEHSENYSKVAEELGLFSDPLKSMASCYSVNAMRDKFKCAVIDRDLFDVLSDVDNRKAIENLLVTTYLTYAPPKNRLNLYMLIGASLLILAA